MPFPSSPIQSHVPQMATITVQQAGEVFALEVNAGPATGLAAPHNGDLTRYVERERPADQNEWTDADLYSLRRDREQAQNVRDFYMLSNPGEFPDIFTDEVEEGEERITTNNFLRGRVEADAELYNDLTAEEPVRDSRWHAEVIEMHQSGNCNDEPNIDRRQNQQMIPSFNSNGDEDMPARRHHDHLDSARCSFTGMNDDDSDEEDDPREFFNFADYPHGSLSATLVAQIHAHCEGMSEEQRQEFESDLDDNCVATLQNDHLPRWQAETLADFVLELRNAGVMREEYLEEQDARQEARNIARRLEAQLPDAQPRFEELCAEYQRAEALFAASDADGFKDWREFRDIACRVATTPVRRCDIFNWYPSLPDDFRECLQDLSNFQRNVAMIRFQVKKYQSRAEGEVFAPDAFNEEEWAGYMQQEGQPFGFELPPFRRNGYGDFQPPATDIPVGDQVRLIHDANTIRAARVSLAAKRIEQGKALPADSEAAAQYLHWLRRARAYLLEFQTEPDGSTTMSEDDQLLVGILYTAMGEIETCFYLEEAQGEEEDGDQASAGA